MNTTLLARTTFRKSHSLRFTRIQSALFSSSSRKSSSSQPGPSKSTSSSESSGKTNVVGSSSCPAGTVMTGLNYIKGEPPIVAKPDEEYPAWLWDLTKPKVLPDDGPGGKADKRRLRLQHRQTLKDNNLFKAK